MSKLIDTELGQFRCVSDGGRERFLFECPVCREMLPMNEEVLAGHTVIDHESRILPGTFCSFQGKRDFGNSLIASIQAQILMGYKPYHDE